MIVLRTCLCCGTEFQVPNHRASKAKYCSVNCSGIASRAAANVVCTTCGKPFHIKKYQLERYSRNMGVFCSRECARVAKIDFMSGENNHQYGLKGKLNASYKGDEVPKKNNNLTEILVYNPDHPRANRDGRVPKHRLIAEMNAEFFGLHFFDSDGVRYFLKSGYIVHHKDGNHNNNDISNLEILTRGEHTSLHNKIKPMEHDRKTGRFVKRNELE